LTPKDDVSLFPSYFLAEWVISHFFFFPHASHLFFFVFFTFLDWLPRFRAGLRAPVFPVRGVFTSAPPTVLRHQLQQATSVLAYSGVCSCRSIAANKYLSICPLYGFLLGFKYHISPVTGICGLFSSPQPSYVGCTCLPQFGDLGLGFPYRWVHGNI